MGLVKTKEHISVLAEHNFFIAVIYPLKLIFYVAIVLSIFQKSTVLGSKFAWNI